MNKKNVMSWILSIVFLAGCSESKNPANQDPKDINPGSISGLSVISKAKAEFDLSSNPDGSAQFNLVKKSYAVAPNCLHGQCTDYTDITVTNSGSTQFELLQSQAQISQNTSNQNLTNIVDLKIATLFDNNLTSCGGQKCTAAAIRIYTTDSTGVQGAGLWSQAIGKSVPLTVSGGSSNSILASVPYFSAAGTPDDGKNLQIDLDPLAVDKNVLSLAMADFSDAAPAGAGYTLSADFTQAGAGTYKAHVVVEYDLIGPASITPVTLTLGAIGDSISVGADANLVINFSQLGDLPEAFPQYSWTTGSSLSNSIYSNLNNLVVGGSLPKYNVVQTDNQAVIGATAETSSIDLLMQIPLTANAQVVTLEIGANDVCSGSFNAANFKSNVQSVVNSLATSANPPKVIIIPSIPNIAQVISVSGSPFYCPEVLPLMCPLISEVGGSASLPSLISSANTALSQIQGQGSTQVVYDQGAVNGVTLSESEISTDCFHPNITGQNLFGSTVWSAVGSQVQTILQQ
jgi:lysophospholipase L1-like esterase